jgi:hypothetical protein
MKGRCSRLRGRAIKENDVREVAVKRAWLAAVAMAAMLSAQAAGRSLDGLIESVVRSGADAQLPAHLSVVLGVTAVERTTAVKQAVVRDGSAIRTFNVCTANHEDVVILTYDEQSRSTKAYLVSAKGALRKAVNYQAGAAANERSPADARSDFAYEIGFWTNFPIKPAPFK